MKNVDMKISGKRLVITVDLSKELGPSKSSGKSMVIATSQGNQPIGDERNTKIGLNVYRPI